MSGVVAVLQWYCTALHWVSCPGDMPIARPVLLHRPLSPTVQDGALGCPGSPYVRLLGVHLGIMPAFIHSPFCPLGRTPPAPLHHPSPYQDGSLGCPGNLDCSPYVRLLGVLSRKYGHDASELGGPVTAALAHAALSTRGRMEELVETSKTLHRWGWDDWELPSVGRGGGMVRLAVGGLKAASQWIVNRRSAVWCNWADKHKGADNRSHQPTDPANKPPNHPTNKPTNQQPNQTTKTKNKPTCLTARELVMCTASVPYQPTQPKGSW